MQWRMARAKENQESLALSETVRCPDCGKETYAGAPSCYQCGHIYESVAARRRDDGGLHLRTQALLKRSLGVLNRNLGPFLCLSFLIYLPVIAFEIFGGAEAVLEYAPSAPPFWIGAAIVVSYWTIYALVTAAIAYGVVRDLNGEKAGFRDCVGSGIRLAIPVSGLALVQAILLSVTSVALVVPGLIAYTLLWVAVPVAVIEKRGIAASFNRSIDLTRGSGWTIFFIILTFAVIGFVLGGPLDMLSTQAGRGGGADHIARMTIRIFLDCLIGLANGVVIAVGYCELRASKEGASISEITADLR